MKEAILYKKLKNKLVKCEVCNHFCKIPSNGRGICGIRENRDGKLFLLTYGKAIAEHVDPIEKKPFYHFLPNSFSLSFSTVGCNFNCKNCQNWEIAHLVKKTKLIEGFDLPPEKIIEDTIKFNCKSIAYTYTEPTVFLEYCLDTMKLAKKHKLKNVWVSNGFMSEKTLNLILPYLDAINVDLKSFEEKFYQKICKARLKPVLENLKEIKKANIHLEITTLIIPGLNDKENELKKIAKFIKEELSPEVPWHISRFFPAYQLTNLPPTPIETLEKAKKIGEKIGLKYIYLGNV